MVHRLVSIMLLAIGVAASCWVFFTMDAGHTERAPLQKMIPAEVEFAAKINTSDWTYFAQSTAYLADMLPESLNDLKTALAELDSARKGNDQLQGLLTESPLLFCGLDFNTSEPKWALLGHLPNGAQEQKGYEYFSAKVKKATTIERHSRFLICSDTTTFTHAFESVVADSLLLSNTIQWGTSPLNLFFKGDTPGESMTYDLVFQNNQAKLVGTSKSEVNFGHEHFSRVDLNELMGKLPQQCHSIQGWAGKGMAFAKWKKSAMENQGTLAQFNARTSETEVSCSCNIQDLLFDNLANWCRVSTADKDFLVLQIMGIQDRFDEYMPLMGSNITLYKDRPIFELDGLEIIGEYLSQEDFAQQQLFATVSDQFLIIGRSSDKISWYINQLIADRTFSYLPESLEIQNALVARQGFFEFHKENSLKLANWTSEGPLQSTLKQTCASSTGMYIAHTFLGNEVAASKSSTGWNITLDSRLSSPPALVRNHYTGAKEVVIQDNSNKLHLIDENGKGLWQYALDGKIESKIHQVDIFRNGKLQLIFNTSTAIHCLDRNGKKVEGFPIALPSKASSPLAIFDYDNKRDYRFLIGCTDGMVYNYKIDGSSTRGWKYQQSNNAVIALSHIKIKSKDYIFALEKGGAINLLKRNGKSRYDSPAVARHYAGGGYYFIKGNSIENTRLIYPDSLGNIVISQFDQSDSENSLTGFSSGSQIVVADVNGDKKDDFVIADEKELAVYDHEFNRLFRESHDGNIVQEPKVYRFSSVDRKVGVAVPSTDQIFLYNAKGELETNFPMPGSGPFSIGDLNGDGKLQLVGFFDHGEVFMTPLN